MQESEPLPAPKGLEKESNARLQKLGNQVEQGGIKSLLMQYDPEAKGMGGTADEIINCNSESRLLRKDKELSNERTTTRTIIEMERAQEAQFAGKADHASEESEKLRIVGTLLNTHDLPLLSHNQSQQISATLSKVPEIKPEEHIKVEVATELGFEDIDLNQLAPIAEKLGHPLFHDGTPDFQNLSDPQEQFFLATLSALITAYNRSKELLPVRTFAELPVDDMKALHTLFRNELKNHHPHLHPNAQYKGMDLRRVAEAVLAEANAAREKAGTDLFVGVVAEFFRK